MWSFDLFLFFKNYLDVKKGTEESAWKEVSLDCRRIEGPNAPSFTEKSEEHQQKINRDHIAINKERLEARARIENQ